jgi:hypothetical protein
MIGFWDAIFVAAIVALVVGLVVWYWPTGAPPAGRDAAEDQVVLK